MEEINSESKRIDVFDQLNEDLLDAKSNFIKQKLEERESNYKQRQFRTEEEQIRRQNNTELFFEPFNKLENDFKIKLAECKSASKIVEGDAELLLTILQNMQNLISANTTTLSGYDVKHSQTIVEKFRDELNDTKTKLTPVKKFAFKRTQPKQATQQPATPILTNKIPEQPKNVLHIPDHFQLKNFANSHIIITPDGYFVNNVAQQERKELLNEFHLLKGENCKIEIQGKLETLRIIELNNCEIFVGPVARSVSVDYCKDCIFQLASQQIRIHNSSKCTFYVLAKSGPIIEDCTEMKFAKYSYTFSSVNSLLEETNLPETQNNWDQVRDFNWFKSTPSPNYSLILPQ